MRAKFQITNGMGGGQESGWAAYVTLCSSDEDHILEKSFSGRPLYMYVYLSTYLHLIYMCISPIGPFFQSDYLVSSGKLVLILLHSLNISLIWSYFNINWQFFLSFFAQNGAQWTHGVFNHDIFLYLKNSLCHICLFLVVTNLNANFSLF